MGTDDKHIFRKELIFAQGVVSDRRGTQVQGSWLLAHGPTGGQKITLHGSFHKMR